MQTGWNENRALLCGTVAGEPVLSHENHGVSYDVFPLSVPPPLRGRGPPQRSGGPSAADGLSPGPRRPRGGPGRGPLLQQPHRTRQPPGHHPLRGSLSPTRAEPANCLELSGVLCKPPILRRTPLGREICDLMLAVNRKYGRADYLPCIAWGTLAHAAAACTWGRGQAGGAASESELPEGGGRRDTGPHGF